MFCRMREKRGSLMEKQDGSRRNGSPSHGFEDQILSLESYDRFVRNKYIVFQLILHCKDKFSAAFMNKIKFLV